MMVLQVIITVVSPILNEDPAVVSGMDLDHLEVVLKTGLIEDPEAWVAGILIVTMNSGAVDVATKLGIAGPNHPEEVMMVFYQVEGNPIDHHLEAGRGVSVELASNAAELGTEHLTAPTMKTISHASEHPILTGGEDDINGKYCILCCFRK